MDNDTKEVDESDKSKTEMDKRSLDQKGDMATMTGHACHIFHNKCNIV